MIDPTYSVTELTQELLLARRNLLPGFYKSDQASDRRTVPL